MAIRDINELEDGGENPSLVTPMTPNVNEDATASTLPSYRKLATFIATTIIIWLSEPLLSLVDTTVVSMTSQPASAILQIAALGPATILYDSEIYTTYFLAIATTNQLAPIFAKQEWKKLRKATSNLMGLAVLMGSLIMVTNYTLGKGLLGRMVGTMTEPGILPLATKYVWIRSLVAPCVIMEHVAQSFCLTTMNTKTPAVAVLVASIVNIIGDLVLTPRLGIQGAAIATALASLSSCLILLSRVRKVTKDWKQKQYTEEQAAGLATASSTESSDDIPFWSLPDKKSFKDLVLLAGPIFFVMMGKVGCYSALTLRATGLGVVNLATHNIMMRIFFFFSCFGDSLGQAAQSFFPQVANIDRKKLIQRLLGASAVVGLVNCLSSSILLTRLSGYLTKEVAISQLMRQFATYVCVTELIHPFVMLMEGLVLAKRDFVFLVALYFSTSVAHLGFVFSKFGSSFGGLWQALLVFQSLRFGQFAIRTMQQARKEQGSMKTA
ncbi:MAG: hypothetical protein SGBAC_002041 [Bacillariaceae sp.]